MIFTTDFIIGIGQFIFGVGVGIVIGVMSYWVLQQIALKLNKGTFVPYSNGSNNAQNQ